MTATAAVDAYGHSLLTAPQVAEGLAVSVSKVYKLIRCGDLQAHDLGTAQRPEYRVSERQLNDYLRTRPDEIAPHGTYARWQAHQKAGETPCDDCRIAQRDYMRQRRANNPAARDYDRAYGRARRRALETLAREFPTEFQQLMDHEMSAVPRLTPVRPQTEDPS